MELAAVLPTEAVPHPPHITGAAVLHHSEVAVHTEVQADTPAAELPALPEAVPAEHSEDIRKGSFPQVHDALKT